MESKYPVRDTLYRIFRSRVYSAAKTLQPMPQSFDGIIFYSTELKDKQTDPENPQYRRPFVGNAYVITEEQKKQILEILQKDTTGLEKINRGQSSKE